MILFDLANTEAHPAYQSMAISNGDRQYSFLKSAVTAACETQQFFLSQTILKALNYHAIACLHTNAGEYRPCEVHVRSENSDHVYTAPHHFRVAALMDNFINVVNSAWSEAEPATLAAHVLWQVCAIHPFINGNGRTARAAAYFAVCVKSGGWLPGEETLPTLLKQSSEYTPALKNADKTGDISDLVKVIQNCLKQQISPVKHDHTPKS